MSTFVSTPYMTARITIEHDPLAADLVNLVLDYPGDLHRYYDCCPKASSSAFGELTAGTDIVCKAR